MKLTELLSGIETLQRAGAPETDITSLGFDSRHATAGQLFFAVKGSASDGHDYMAQATANGAAAVVCERLPEEPFPGVAYWDFRLTALRGLVTLVNTQEGPRKTSSSQVTPV